ncbi:hypothetical protein FB45DRAFT_825784 [Roridomyces roridus]|uniref:SigF-like NTF2-like domain-containing protein n=1 Tax=Roridomyces roridus TaxID=1738132 RepID=A0AAD7C8A0_9AGAR|nr:hypothetical protein FB45DRAFT_825784 [Roridomyces roridus]
MEDPVGEVSKVVSLITTAASPDIQKAAFLRYFTSDAGFRHPLCNVTPSPGSRDKLLGIYQWYRIMSPHLDLTVTSVVQHNNVLLLDIVQKFHLRLSPLKPAPARLLVRLTLREENGLHYIAFQEDFYHPDDFMAMLIPPLSPVIRAALSATSIMSGIYAKVGQLLGFWSLESSHSHTDTRGLYD